MGFKSYLFPWLCCLLVLGMPSPLSPNFDPPATILDKASSSALADEMKPQVRSAANETNSERRSLRNTYGDTASPIAVRLASVFQAVYPDYTYSPSAQSTHSSDVILQNAPSEVLVFTASGKKRLIAIHLIDTSTIISYAETSGDAPAVVVSTGLLQTLENDDQLAFVLAHEFAHIEMEHLAFDEAGFVLSERQLRHIATVREQWELDADKAAIAQLRKSGFDASAATRALRSTQSAMLNSHQAHSKAELGTHPGTSRRLSELTRLSALNG